MNPTTDVLEKRVALLEGAPEMGGLGVASGTAGVFYSIITSCSISLEISRLDDDTFATKSTS
jgi:O-acetylhomoserine/O-acetylserine sulfhydrylase-like pyridoxal-dependent enzyme